MYKLFALFSFGFLISLTGYSQSVSAFVISSAGGSGSTSGLQLSSNPGEIQINTLSGSITLTQGFLQPELYTTSVDETEYTIDIKIFPNPFSNFITLNLLETISEDITFSLYDITGKIVYTSLLKNGSVSESFILPELKDGFYFIQFNLGSEKLSMNYKLVHL